MPSPKLSSRRLALISGFALLAVIGAASVCSADSPWRRRIAPSPPPPYRVSLEALDGAVLPTFRHGGRGYVLGEPGARYNIRVDNPTSARVEVVVTVDGRDAVSGQVGDYVTQRGYLVEPWGTLLIEGFRRSLDQVAAFRFTDRSQSYSALRGTPEHVGVVGVAVFPEKPRAKAPVWRPRRHSPPPSHDGRAFPESAGAAPEGRAEKSRSAPADAEAPRAAPAPGYRGDGQAFDDDAPRWRKGGSSAGPSNIGTEYGENQGSSVVEVAFERRSPTHPSALLTLRYDDYDGLSARGIDLSSLGYAYRYDQGEPEPFPHSRFAPPPR